MDTKELLKKRRTLKAKKPRFSKQDAHKKKRLSSSWRKPRGSDSKMRVGKKGYRRSVRVGWGSPKTVKGMDREGLIPLSVNSVADLDKADPKINIIIIGTTVGAKKRIEIIEKAISKNLKVANYKDPAKISKELKEQFEKKKSEKQQLKQEREKKREAVKKEAEKKKEKKEKKEAEKTDDEEEMTPEEKKMEEKKDKDKMLISTQ